MEDNITLKAAADLRTFQYRVMRVSAAETCNVSSDATDSAACGILQNKPNTNQGATIMRQGITKVEAGAAITAGDHCTYDGSGKAITIASGDMSIGQALQTAGADADIIEIMAYPPVRWAGAA